MIAKEDHDNCHNKQHYIKQARGEREGKKKTLIIRQIHTKLLNFDLIIQPFNLFDFSPSTVI